MSAPPVTSWLRAGKIAGVGLAAVLVFLGVFAVWSSNRSVNAASQLKRSQLVSSAYAQARFAMDDERLLEHQYMVGHGGNYSTALAPGLHAKFDEALADLASREAGALHRDPRLLGQVGEGDDVLPLSQDRPNGEEQQRGQERGNQAMSASTE